MAIGTNPLHRAVLLSLANQSIASGGNFLLSLYLARTMSLDQFGIYTMCYGACMLFVGVGNALLLTQMTVSMNDRAPDARPAYAACTLWGVLLMGMALLILVSVASASLSLLGYTVWPAIELTALASALLLCTEFFISHAYLQQRESSALQINCTTMFTLWAGLAMLALLGYTADARSALLLYALGAALSSTLAYASAPLAARPSMRMLRDEWTSAWRHGSWALSGVAVTWIQAQSATYALAAVLGPAGAGLANLGRLFIAPFAFLLPALNKVALPRLAALRSTEPRRMRQLSTRMTTALVLLATVYAFPLLATLDWLAPVLLGHTVAELRPLVAVWCLVLVAQIARSGGAQLLQMQLKFRMLTLLNIPSAIIAVAAALLLMPRFTQNGAVAGVFAGELTLAILIWKEIHHGIRTERPASS